MKERNFFGLFCLLFIGFLLVSCDTGTKNSGDTYRLKDYQEVGASVAAREWTTNYDCSNFSVQFYQNCLKAGLPCRVRLGLSGGSSFEVGNHAWNSVKINGKWVSWEPQFNDVYDGHYQTRTPDPDSIYFQEDYSRIIYEMVGRYVPESIINLYEIDTHWDTDSPFYPFYVPVAYCLTDDLNVNVQALVSELSSAIPDNDSGGIFFMEDNEVSIFFFFKYNNKYYGMDNLQENDPMEGRSIVKQNSIEDLLHSDADFVKIDVDRSYK